MGYNHDTPNLRILHKPCLIHDSSRSYNGPCNIIYIMDADPEFCEFRSELYTLQRMSETKEKMFHFLLRIS